MAGIFTPTEWIATSREDFMLEIAVCDDSRIDIELIEKVFDGFKNYPIEYDVFFHAKELLDYCEKHQKIYHLYIFDIEMPEMDGLTLAENIRAVDTKAVFVFLTSHKEHAMKAFKVRTFDFIVKPVTTEKMEPVLLKIIQYLDMARKDFVFSFRKNQFRLGQEDILYFEKKGRKVVIHTVSETLSANMKTEELWKQLEERIFVPIHLSYIVNLGHLKAVEGDEAVLDNGERLSVSRPHKQKLKEKHLEFARRMM